MDTRRLAPASLLALLTAGPGPACVSCDCAEPGLLVHVEDADGGPLGATDVEARLEGELLPTEACPFPEGCDRWFFPFDTIPEQGSTIAVTLTVGGEDYSHTVVTPAPTEGGCCGTGLYVQAFVPVVEGSTEDTGLPEAAVPPAAQGQKTEHPERAEP